MKLTTRSIVITGMLGALTIVLGATGLGLIPVPTPAGRATILHIPVILAGILEGPVVGAFVGLIFGLYSFLTAPSALAADPLISVVPRFFIGVVAYYVYRLGGKNIYWRSALAAIAGTLTNTVGFLGMAVVRGYLPSWQVALGLATLHGVPEIILAVIIVVVLVKAFQKKYLH
ncbi:MAG: ECF transporter S component [Clostridia bacterium]|nr:ECF transporter S component [Clostridia bacterium]